MKFKLVFFLLLSLFVSSNALAETTSSSNYSIEINSVNSGGEFSNSASYYLEDTSGELDSGGLEGTVYSTTAGYQQASAVAAGGGGGNGLIGMVIEPIEIYNVEVSVVDGSTVISWETNKPTNASLILGENVGGTEEGYVDELFMPYHSVEIEGLYLGEELFFKIFAEGTFGDDNYDSAQLYSITNPRDQASDSVIDSGSSLEDLPDYVIKEVGDITGKDLGIVPPEREEVEEIEKNDENQKGVDIVSQIKTILTSCWPWCLPITAIILLLIFIRKKLIGV